MVDVAKIQNDIQTLSQKLGVAVFYYDDIHNKKIKNEFHYDYKKLILKISVLKKMDFQKATKYLCDQDILIPLPYGEYEINVGQGTKTGGGTNFGDVFFVFDKNDYQTIYHELAHSLQRKYHLFGQGKINQLYDISKGGLKKTTDWQKKVLTKQDYKLYLQEMHAEIFGFAVLMLRSEGKFDFWKQALQAYHSSILRNSLGMTSFGRTVYNSSNSAKFYVTKSVMKPMIKKLYLLKKQRKTEQFFDKKGHLNDKELAKFCETVVLKNAYSPRTLYAFFNYDLLDHHAKREKGWKKDTLKSLIISPMAFSYHGLKVQFWKQLFSLKRHEKLLKKQYKKVKKFYTNRVVYDDREYMALQEVERIHALINMTAKVKSSLDIKNFFQFNLLLMQKNPMPDGVMRYCARQWSANKAGENYFYNALAKMQKIVTENKDNPYFAKIIEADVSDFGAHYLSSLKKEYPRIKITNHLKGSPTDYGFVTYPIVNGMKKMQNLFEKYKIDEKNIMPLVRSLLSDEMCFESRQCRNELCQKVKISGDFWGMKNRKFKKDLDDVVDFFAKQDYVFQNDFRYPIVLNYLATVSDENFVESVEKLYRNEKQKILIFSEKEQKIEFSKLNKKDDDKIQKIKNYKRFYYRKKMWSMRRKMKNKFLMPRPTRGAER